MIDEALYYVDLRIQEGYRGEAKQNKAFREGKSTKRFPDGNHNTYPSTAVDIYPYPIPANTAAGTRRYCWTAGVIAMVAAKLGIDLRQGINWDGDSDFGDQRLNDLVHHEIK